MAETSTIGFIRIGMGVSTAGLTKGFAAAGNQVKSFGSTITSGLGSAVGIIAAGAAAFGGFSAIKGAITAASDLNEQISKSKTVFGDSADVVFKEADRMAEAFGIPKTEFIDGATSIGLIAKASGLAQGPAAELGVKFAKAAADAASFYNVPVEEALTSIRSGLVGEAEPLRRFGVLLSADAVEAEAARMGMQKLGGELTEGQKVQARSSLITKGLSDAHGDLARTADSPANAMRSLGGQFQNLSAEIGTVFMPAFSAALKIVGDGVNGLGTIFESNKATLQSWGQSFASRITESGAVIGTVVTSWPDIFERVSIVIGGIWTNVGEIFDFVIASAGAGISKLGGLFGWLGSVIGAFLDWFSSNWLTIFNDAFTAPGIMLMNLGENIVGFFQEMQTWAGGFGEAWDFQAKSLTADTFLATPKLEIPDLSRALDQVAMPELRLSSVEDQLAAIDQRMVDKALAKPTVAAAGSVPGAEPVAGGPAVTADKKLLSASAAEFGSSEAAKTMSSFLNFGAKGMGGVEKNTAATAAEVKGLRTDLRQAGLLKGGDSTPLKVATIPG